MDTDLLPKSQASSSGPPADAVELSPESLAAGHETTDVSIKSLTIFGVSLLGFLLAVLAVITVFYKGFSLLNTAVDSHRQALEPAASSVVRVTPNYVGPLIQVKPEEDLRWMRDHDRASLGTYGWVDRPAGVVRLPVTRAMELLVARGVPPLSPGKTMEDLQRQRAQPPMPGQPLRP